MLRKSGFPVLAQKGPECRLSGKIESIVVARDGRKMRGHVFHHLWKLNILDWENWFSSFWVKKVLKWSWNTQVAKTNVWLIRLYWNLEVTTRGPPQVSFCKMPDLELKRCLHDVYRFSVIQLIAHENMIQLLKNGEFMYVYISMWFRSKSYNLHKVS